MKCIYDKTSKYITLMSKVCFQSSVCCVIMFCGRFKETAGMSKRFHMTHCQQNSTSEAPPRYTELEGYLITNISLRYYIRYLLTTNRISG